MLIGQYSLLYRIPIDDCFFSVCHAILNQSREEPLLPFVVFGTAGCQLARPVVSKSQTHELLFHVFNVLVGPLRRRHLVFDRSVFCRQPERIPSHRLQHILAQHALMATHCIANGIVSHMPHVQRTGRVRKHRQTVELFLFRVFYYLEAFMVLPVLLCGDFYGSRVVLNSHKERVLLPVQIRWLIRSIPERHESLTALIQQKSENQANSAMS